jgi:hypothetical protein
MNTEVKIIPEQKTPSTNYLSFAEQAGKGLAVLAATLLIMSICYDFSYLKAVGLSLNEVPSLTAEHVRSAILWGPGLVLSILGGAVYELFMRRLENGLSEGDILARSSNTIRKFRKSADKLPIFVLGTVFLGTALFDTGYTWAYVAFIFLWGVLSVSIVTHARMGAGFTRISKLMFCALPCVLAFVGLSGYHGGTKLIAGTTPIWELTIRVGTATTRQTLTGLRRFSTFAIAIDQGRSVTVIPNDAILAARRLEKVLPPEMNLCRWLGIQCIQPSPAGAVEPSGAKPAPQPVRTQ